MADLDNITQFSGITITSDQKEGINNPNACFALPCVTTKQRDKLENVTPYVVNEETFRIKPGTMIYNIDRACIQIFINAQWQNLFAVATTATGVGLTSGIPFVFPTGKKENVETVEANKVDGFTYYDTTEGALIDKTIRTFDQGKWGSITVTPDD
jgi:hypothetical protein